MVAEYNRLIDGWYNVVGVLDAVNDACGDVDEVICDEIEDAGDDVDEDARDDAAGGSSCRPTFQSLYFRCAPGV